MFALLIAVFCTNVGGNGGILQVVRDGDPTEGLPTSDSSFVRLHSSFKGEIRHSFNFRLTDDCDMDGLNLNIDKNVEDFQFQKKLIKQEFERV